MLAATMGENPVRASDAGSRYFGRVAVRLEAAGPVECAAASGSASPSWLCLVERSPTEVSAMRDSPALGWPDLGVDGGSGAATLYPSVSVSSAMSRPNSSFGRSSRLCWGKRRTVTFSELLAPGGRGTNSGEKAGLVEFPGT